MFKFLHRKALENSINDLERYIQTYPHLDYAGPMNDVVAETIKVLPKGLSQTPCPATRAYCVDLQKLANKAYGIGLGNVWLAFTAVNIYFSAWNISYHDPKDYQALSIKNRARSLIDRFYTTQRKEAVKSSYGTFEEWYEVFVKSAGEMNQFLALNEEYSTPIDFMDNAPLKKAFADGVDPITLGKEFGKDFDVAVFGK